MSAAPPSSDAALHAGVLQIGAGLVCVGAALQVGLAFTFVSPWPGRAVLAQGVLGLALIGVGTRLSDGEARWRRPAAALDLVLLVGSAAFDAWLASNQAAAGLALAAPAMVGLASAWLALAWVEIGRWTEFRDRVLAETGGGALASWVAPRSVPVAPTAILGLVLSVAVALHLWPAEARRFATRVDALARGAWPSAPAAEDYPLPGSPLAWYAAYEAQFLPLQEEAVLSLGDAIARDVAWELANAAGTGDLAAAERALWEAGREREIIGWIARELRDRGVFYHEESLLSRSFDPTLHRVPGAVHLDCDQLVWMMLHVGRALDLGFYAVPAPFHAYLTYAPPTGLDRPALTVETTAFRDPETGEAGDGLFVAPDHYREGRNGAWATEELSAAAGFFEPMDEAWIRDAIASEVTRGVAKLKGDAAVRDAQAERVGAARDPNLVTNYWHGLCRDAAAALAAGQAAEAQALAARAVALRADKGVLVTRGERLEAALLGRALAAQGQRAEAAAAVSALVAEHGDRSTAESASHAWAVLLHADVAVELDELGFRRWIWPALAYATRRDDSALRDEACARIPDTSAGRRFRARLPSKLCGP